MYQNMYCVVWGYSQFNYSTKYDIYNSANEKIENPVYVTKDNTKIGVMVPYGGYVDIQMDTTHGLNIQASNTDYSIIDISIGSSGKIKVVRDYYTRIITTSSVQTDYQVV